MAKMKFSHSNNMERQVNLNLRVVDIFQLTPLLTDGDFLAIFVISHTVFDPTTFQIT